MKLQLVAALGVLCLTIQASGADVNALKTKKQMESYAVGVDLAKNLRREGAIVDPRALAKGLFDKLSNQKLLLSDSQLSALLNEFQVETAKRLARPVRDTGQTSAKEGEAFLAANKSKPGVVTLPDGLQYLILRKGSGKTPTDTDTVVANLRGTLVDGTEFNNTIKRGQPAVFKVSETVPGLKQALKLMPAGSEWKVFIPSALAYGDRRLGRLIGPNSTLIYDIQLVSIK
ncbi:MAG: FKBP-type peptidyl-prolyl cis-trans isomerase [Syntrophobacteraceae bacterium]|nr:FKBP-type peptidyl-prolyl cis-trans isomerase [Syntrophobacteraceae bacterium]